MKVYIAGPMTGLPDFNYPAFNAKAEELRIAGHTVVNPAELFHGELGLPWDHYMRAGIEALVTCSAITLLPGWSQSKGACLERRIAEDLGMEVVR